MAVTTWSAPSLPADEWQYQRENEGNREQQHNRGNDGRRRELSETAKQHSRLRVVLAFHRAHMMRAVS
jgi:hypothetical protein